MDELRQKFEALGNIKPVIAACTFDESDNEYRSERLPEYSQGFINGAWYVFQNQQSKIEQLEKGKAELESKYKALDALSRMRAAVIRAQKWSSLSHHIKNAIKRLDRKEKALRGERE